MPASLCKLRLHLVYHYVLNTAKVWIVFDVCKDFDGKILRGDRISVILRPLLTN